MAQEDLPALVIDCNLWISILTQPENELKEILFKGTFRVVLTSYMVVEILRVLQRLASRRLLRYAEVESLFWDFCAYPFIIKDFQQPITDSLVNEVRKVPEYLIIAQLLELEVKDVPYLVAAYQHSALLLSNDIRSLVAKRDPIQKHLGIQLITLDEFRREFTGI